ncbi:TPA: phage DNA ejection protein [Serratia fonticola]
MAEFNPIDYSSGNGFGQGLQLAGLYQQTQQQRLEAEQAQQQQAAMQAFQKDWQTAYSSGDPKQLDALVAKYPGQMETVQKAIGFRDDNHRMALGNAARDLRIAMSSGNPEAVAMAAQNHADTLGSVGATPQEIMQQFQQDPKGLLQTVDTVGMGALGVKDYFGVQNDQAQRQIQRDQLAETIRSNKAGEGLQAQGQNLSYSAQMARLNHDKMVYKQSQAAINKADAAGEIDAYKLNAQIASTGMDPLTGKPATGARLNAAKRWLEGNQGFNEALITGQRGIEKINGLLANEKLEGVGKFAGRIPEIGLSDAGIQSRNSIEELKSGAFVQNVQMLKGMGALSNAEGEKLQNLISKLDVTQPEEVVRRQLGEIRSQYATLQRVSEAEAAAMGYSSQGFDTYVQERQKPAAGPQSGAPTQQAPAAQPQSTGSYTSKSGIQFKVE